MSRTHRHKILGKWNNGLIDRNDVPINIRKFWKRINWDIGEFKALRLKKMEQIIDTQNEKEI